MLAPFKAIAAAGGLVPVVLPNTNQNLKLETVRTSTKTGRTTGDLGHRRFPYFSATGHTRELSLGNSEMCLMNRSFLRPSNTILCENRPNKTDTQTVTGTITLKVTTFSEKGGDIYQLYSSSEFQGKNSINAVVLTDGPWGGSGYFNAVVVESCESRDPESIRTAASKEVELQFNLLSKNHQAAVRTYPKFLDLQVREKWAHVRVYQAAHAQETKLEDHDLNLRRDRIGKAQFVDLGKLADHRHIVTGEDPRPEFAILYMHRSNGAVLNKDQIQTVENVEIKKQLKQMRPEFIDFLRYKNEELRNEAVRRGYTLSQEIQHLKLISAADFAGKFISDDVRNASMKQFLEENRNADRFGALRTRFNEIKDNPTKGLEVAGKDLDKLLKSPLSRDPATGKIETLEDRYKLLESSVQDLVRKTWQKVANKRLSGSTSDSPHIRIAISTGTGARLLGLERSHMMKTVEEAIGGMPLCEGFPENLTVHLVWYDNES